jgi:hypothetical protein
MRGIYFVLMLLVILTGGCRKEAPPKTVAIREDGVLELTLCSFNVRYEGDQDKSWRSWPNRIDRVVKTLREVDPDVFGIQEALHGQAADGTWLRGVDTFVAMYEAVGLPWVAQTLNAPGLRTLADHLYPWVARNRRLFPRWLAHLVFETAMRRAAHKAV